MAQVVLGIGTSHTPLLVVPPEKWASYAEVDRTNPELVCPPEGWTMSFEEAVKHAPAWVRHRSRDIETFQKQSEACQTALDSLGETICRAEPDVTLIISDDQDEWFFEDNMPTFSIYWGETAPLKPRTVSGQSDPEIRQAMIEGYGATEWDVPVASAFGRSVVEHLTAQHFDVSHFNYVKDEHGGSVARRYPTRTGELDLVRSTATRPQGLPHGYAFVVTRLLNSRMTPILPIFQNTCYPPNTPTPSRCGDFGKALAGAIRAWPDEVRVAVVASGGLSHFVVDEELDRTVLDALKRKDGACLGSLPRHRLYSATSELLNWVTLGPIMWDAALEMELLDYVPVYRTEAGTGGGWAFARWT